MRELLTQIGKYLLGFEGRKVVALVGDFGVGKSTVARILSSLSSDIIHLNCDEFKRKTSEKKECPLESVLSVYDWDLIEKEIEEFRIERDFLVKRRKEAGSFEYKTFNNKKAKILLVEQVFLSEVIDKIKPDVIVEIKGKSKRKPKNTDYSKVAYKALEIYTAKTKIKPDIAFGNN